MTEPGERVVVLSVPIDLLTVPELHERLLRFVRAGARATVLHAKVHAINLAQRFAWFGDRLRQAGLVYCDGHGVMLGARLLGHRLPGADHLCRMNVAAPRQLPAPPDRGHPPRVLRHLHHLA